MATELVGVAGEVLLQEVEVMVVEEAVRGQRVLPRSSPTLSLGRGGLRLAAWELILGLKSLHPQSLRESGVA